MSSIALLGFFLTTATTTAIIYPLHLSCIHMYNPQQIMACVILLSFLLKSPDTPRVFKIHQKQLRKMTRL
jgi:hypothetical protein